MPRIYPRKNNRVSNTRKNNRVLAVSRLVEAITRNFISVSAAAAEYINLAQSITLSGDFEIELDFATNPDNSKCLIGSTPSFIRIGGSAYQYMINGNYYSTGVLATTDGSLNTFAMTRTGTVGKLFENGAEVDSRAVVTDDFLIENIFSRGAAGNHFDGIIANVKIWSGGDRNTGTLILDMPLDESMESSNVFRSRTATEWPELWTGSPDKLTNGWVDNGDGTFTHAGSVNGELQELGGFEEGEIYVIALTTTGQVFVQLGGPPITDNQHAIVNAGSYEIVLPAESLSVVNGLRFLSYSNGTTVSNISARKVTGGTYGQGVNLTSDNSGLYTQEDTSWIGPDLITSSVWENPASAGGQWSFSNDQWSISGDGTLNALQLLLSGAIPAEYRLSGNCVSVDNVLAVVNTGSVNITEAGSYSFDIANNPQIYKRSTSSQGGTGIVTATLDKPSIRHILRTA